MSGGEDTSTVTIVLGFFFLVGVPLIVAVINVLKGKYWFALIGFFVAGSIGLIGAIRLAKPNSRWARRYGEDKMAKSMNRFPQQAARIDPDWADNLRAHPLVVRTEQLHEWPDEDPALWDKITRKAYKKQHGHWPGEA